MFCYRLTREVNNEKTRADTLKQDLDRVNEALRRQKDDFDNKLRDLTRNHEDVSIHLVHLKFY